jgi:hypothetical protein
MKPEFRRIIKTKEKKMKLLGILLLIVGIAVLVFGAYNLISYNTSTAGKISNKIAGAFGTQTKAVQNSLIQICIGAGCAVVGFVLSKKR